MTREAIFDAITEINDELVLQAAAVRPRRKVLRRIEWIGAAAAAAVLTIGLGIGLFSGRLNFQLPGGSTGGSGHSNNETVFTSYAGPVFPLTLREADSSITAEREITLDFEPWTPVWVPNEDFEAGGYYKASLDIPVTDAYTLFNTSSEDKTVLVIYPFAGNYRELEKQQPVLTADGTQLETTLHAGADGSNRENPGDLQSWEQYKTLLADGSYQQGAFEGYPDLSDIPVIVYQFTDPWGPEPDDEAGIPNPTLRNSFNLDYSKTVVLSYGFNGTSLDRENGWMDKQFSIPRPGAIDENDPCYLIVVGEDISPIDTQGYATGGWDTKKTVNAGVTIQRYETDLESAMRTVLWQQYNRWETNLRDFEMYFGLMKEQLLTCGVLSEDPAERGGTGDIEDLDTYYAKRIFYLEAQVTISAGGSVLLTAEMKKEASFDFACSGTENQGIYGYDTVTKLGSNLFFVSQKARAIHTESVEIVRQNYGFDWENGVDEVTLSPDMEHYYLEIRQKDEAETETE